jgi:hypothetical protein
MPLSSAYPALPSSEIAIPSDEGPSDLKSPGLRRPPRLNAPHLVEQRPSTRASSRSQLRAVIATASTCAMSLSRHVWFAPQTLRSPPPWVYPAARTKPAVAPGTRTYQERRAWRPHRHSRPRAAHRRQIDLCRVRHARHALLSRALGDPDYDPARAIRKKSKLAAEIAKPDPRWRAIEGATMLTRLVAKLKKQVQTLPMGPQKFATILSDMTQRLAAMDRYERPALSRRKYAIRAFDEARSTDNIALLPLIPSPIDQNSCAHWRNPRDMMRQG